MENRYVDKEYRTSLGTAFYDRVRELGALTESVEANMLTVVYGPRGVGKSELVRYWGRRRTRKRLVEIRADLLSSPRLPGLREALSGPRDAVERLARELSGVLGELRLIGIAVSAAKALRSLLGETIIFIDEFHLLPGYGPPLASPARGEALRDLEALAHYLTRTGQGPRIVVTVSEGFIATGGVLERLHGYSVATILVEHMDRGHFGLLYGEYRSLRGCSLGYGSLWGLVGGAPGYLPLLCRAPGEAKRLVRRSKSLLETALSDARQGLGIESEEGPRWLLAAALRLARGEAFKPLEEPRLHVLAEVLTLHNILYPAEWSSKGAVYRPQLPVYRLILEVAVERGYTSVLPVPEEEVLRRAAGTG